MPKTTKYKSVSISVETYKKLLLLATSENRNLSQQFRLLVDRHLDELTTPKS